MDIGEHRGLLKVTPMTDREDVARLLSKYNLLAVPVVELEALDEPSPQIGFTSMIRKRAGWLCALFLGEMLTATAMQHFESELSQAIVIVSSSPLIISPGGSSGSQATSLIIRALALREVRVSDWR